MQALYKLLKIIIVKQKGNLMNVSTVIRYKRLKSSHIKINEL